MFKVVGMRVAALRAAGAALTAALLLAACGGGEQVVKFAPTRVISFGDESSLILPGGKKYTVNAFKTDDTTVLDCSLNPVWNQYLAAAFGRVFPECNPNTVVTTSKILATNGAKVQDVANQITTFKSTDTFDGKTLVTILVGQNDVIEQYNAVKAGTSVEQAKANMEQLGVTLAGLVNNIGHLGGKTIISTIPDVGTTPFGLAKEAANPGDAALLSTLTERFNSKMRISLIDDGKMTGLIFTYETISGAVKNPGVTFTDVKTPVCTVALPECTTATLIATPTGSSTLPTGDNYLWADDLHLGSGGQRSVGALAVMRATGNPF